MRIFVTGIICLMMVALAPLLAQEKKPKEEPVYGWAEEVVGNLNVTQTNLSNWQQGGEDTWNWQLDIAAKAVNDQVKHNWTNSGKISYGRTKIGDGDDVKSADELRLESTYTYKWQKYVNPYASVTALTQLTSGVEFGTDSLGNRTTTDISKFLAPGYFTESFGLGVEPFKNFKTRLGLAFKQSYTSEELFAARYGIDDDETTEIETLRSEIGMESITDYTRKLSSNIKYTGQLGLFTAFDGGDAVDVRWENVFAGQLAKYLAVSFKFNLLYDKDISLQRQIQQVLAVGVTYTFL